MQRLTTFALVAAIALSTFGCATQPVPTASIQPQSADTTCRKVQPPRKEAVLCGTPAQWAEFDRRAALINAGVTCKFARTPQELCLTAAQWKEREFRLRLATQAANMGATSEGNVARVGATSAPTVMRPVID
jgi:hypothetical protein